MSIDTNNEFLITIVIAVFNGGKTLQKCIDSITNQNFLAKELIIMDGGSTDLTVSILESNDSFITYWESKADRGIAHAWNKALGHAKGEWILFLGSDDRLANDHVLEGMVEILHNDQGNDLVYGKIVFEGGDMDGLHIGSDFDLHRMKRRMTIPHTAAFHRRSFFEEVGQYDEAFKLALDYEILLRKRHLCAHFEDCLVTVMGAEGVSSLLIEKSILECRVAQIKNHVNNRIKIELVNGFYLLRHYYNLFKIKLGSN